MRLSNWLLIAALSATTLSCGSTQPMLAEVPPGATLPIDGVWRETTAKARFQIGAGRIWALDEFVSGGVWKVRPGQVEIMNLKRTGPRTYAGWHPGYKGPYYMSLVAEDRIAILLKAPLGDYTSTLVKVSVDDPARFAAELEGPVPAPPWQDPMLGLQLANTGQSQQNQTSNTSQNAARSASL